MSKGKTDKKVEVVEGEASSSRALHYCRMQDSDMDILKMSKAVLKKPHYEVFTEAVQEMIERRKAWEPKHNLDRYPWFPDSAEGPRHTIAMVESVSLEFEELVAEDDVRFADALYTALYYKTIAVATELNQRLSDTLPEM